MTSEQLDELERRARTSGRKLHPDKVLALIARVRELEADRDQLAAENDRLRAAATVVLQGLRGDEKGEFWSARKWLDDSDIFHDDINGLRVLEEVLRAALAPTPKGQDS